jgi:hypothetical protein
MTQEENVLVKLKSSDGVESSVRKCIPCIIVIWDTDIGLAKDVVMRSVLIKNMVDDIGDESLTEAIPIPNVRNPLWLF